jgi:hypothetical protein
LSVQQGTREEPIDLISDSSDTHPPAVIVQEATRARRRNRRAHRLLYTAQEKVSVANRECLVCGNSTPVTELPSLAGCEHPPQICSTCYSKWITAELQQSNWRESRCPESRCNVELTYNDIQRNASLETFQQYDTFITRAALNEDCKF